MSLTGAQIFKAQKSKLSKVSTPEWGGDVYVRCLRASGHTMLEKLAKSIKKNDIQTDKDSAHMFAMVILTFCDEKGDAIFKETEINKINDLELAPMTRCLNVAMKINGFLDKEAEKAAAKN